MATPPLYDCNNQIGGSTIPLILPSSGSMGNNGALTLTTALDSSYANAFFYMPASAIASGSARRATITELAGMWD